MMKASTRIFRLFGIDIQLHISWWFIFIFLSWALSTSYFPLTFPGFSTREYWFMGIAAALLLFVSVLLHELSHSLVAKTQKIKVESITLFFFGGVAAISDEDMKPRSEFLMAIAGPIFSLFLAGVFFLISFLNGSTFWDAIAFYLYQLNLMLAIFNLVPGFPLDGGRALRAVLYAHYKDLKKATWIAAKGGKFFAGLLVVLGIFGMFTGQGGGLWFMIIGAFLYIIAGASYEQVVVRDVLQRIPVAEVLQKNLPVIDPKTKFADFIKKYANTDADFFLVKGGGKVLDMKQLGKISPDLPSTATVGQLASSLESYPSLAISDTASVAFKKLAESKSGLALVRKGGQLVGFVSQSLLLHRLVWELKYGNLKKGASSVAVKRKVKRP